MWRSDKAGGRLRRRGETAGAQVGKVGTLPGIVYHPRRQYTKGDIMSKQVTYVEKVEFGPSQALRYCVICRDAIRQDDAWRKIRSRDGAYWVAVHDHCLPLARNGKNAS